MFSSTSLLLFFCSIFELLETFEDGFTKDLLVVLMKSENAESSMFSLSFKLLRTVVPTDVLVLGISLSTEIDELDSVVILDFVEVLC